MDWMFLDLKGFDSKKFLLCTGRGRQWNEGVATRTRGRTCVPEKVENKKENEKKKRINNDNYFKMNNLPQVIFPRLFLWNVVYKTTDGVFPHPNVSFQREAKWFFGGPNGPKKGGK